MKWQDDLDLIAIGKMVTELADLPCAWRDRNGQACRDCMRCQSRILVEHYRYVNAAANWKEPNHETD